MAAYRAEGGMRARSHIYWHMTKTIKLRRQDAIPGLRLCVRWTRRERVADPSIVDPRQPQTLR
jgi:hypothetical protein